MLTHKEKAMPDIQTALTNVLGKWEQDEKKQIAQQQEKQMGKPYFTVTNNVSRETFNYIKNHPNLTTAEVARALVKQGFKDGSVTSICAQLSKQGQVLKDERTKRLVALADEYSPLKPSTHFKTGKPKKAESKKAPQNAGLAAIAPQEGELKVPTSIVLTRNYDPHTIVNKLSVMQARQLYDLLKQIFGG